MPVYYREEFILEKVHNQCVLSIGLGGQCEDTSYSFNLAETADISFTVSAKIAQTASRIDFIDISRDAIELFKGKLDAGYFHVDITTPLSDWPDALTHQKYDVIVLGEVLEHIDNPGQALRNLKTLLSPNGQFVITVPNAFFVSGLIKAMLGKEFIHPEHVCYYSPKTLTRLLDMSGLHTTEVAWSRWNRFESSWLIHRISHVFAHLSSLLFPALSDGVVATARIK